MKIIHTVRSASPEYGGPSYSVPALALALSRAGTDTELWTSDTLHQPPTGLPCRQVDARGLCEALQAEKRRSSRLIVHDHGIWLPWNHAVAKAAASTRIPRVVSPRGMLEPWAIGYHSLKKRIAWLLYQKADLQRASLLHASASAEAGHFKDVGLSVPIVVSPNGVEFPPESAFPKPDAARPMRKALFLSRIHPKKGLAELLEAWRQLRPENWMLDIIGPGEPSHINEVSNAIHAANLQQVVHVLPAVSGDAKWAAYAEADLFALPSHSENFGIVIAESLAAGTPVITTQATPWEGLKEHRCGWWVPTGQPALQEALHQALSTLPQELREMGQRGRVWVQSAFSWDAIAQQMLPHYTNLLNGPH